MSGKLMFGGLVAVAVMAMSAGTASAHPPGVVYGGGFYRPAPVVVQPVYRPVVVSPGFGGGWGQPVWGRPVYAGPVWGGGFGPVWGGGFSPGFGGGFGPGWGGGWGRPAFGLSFNFIR
ncbi:MAG: hypothetical protein MUF18_09400 [Fimbriiglobus sp.]|nr:hypothetical protein [Fimbriiglobus sp.]